MTAFLAGQRVTAAQLTQATVRTVAFAQRTSNSTGTTTEIGVLRLDDIPLKAGRRYRIYTNECGIDTTLDSTTNPTASDGGRMVLRYTTDGSTPTTSSTALTLSQILIPDRDHAEYTSVSQTYVPSVDTVFSVLLSVARSQNGSGGTITLTAGSGLPGAIELYIDDMGVNTGNVGTAV